MSGVNPGIANVTSSMESGWPGELANAEAITTAAMMGNIQAWRMVSASFFG
jgi:hypothetical protein